MEASREAGRQRQVSRHAHGLPSPRRSAASDRSEASQGRTLPFCSGPIPSRVCPVHAPLRAHAPMLTTPIGRCSSSSRRASACRRGPRSTAAPARPASPRLLPARRPAPAHAPHPPRALTAPAAALIRIDRPLPDGSTGDPPSTLPGPAPSSARRLHSPASCFRPRTRQRPWRPRNCLRPRRPRRAQYHVKMCRA